MFQRKRTLVCFSIALLVLWIPVSPTQAQPQFWFEALPELPGGASEAFSVGYLLDSEDLEFYSCGQALDGDLINKAVVWTKPAGQPWEIEALPNPFGNTESAAISLLNFDVDLTGFGSCSIGGHGHDVKGAPQPIVWTGDGVGPWTAEVLPLPPGYDSGAVLASVEGVSGVINHSVGRVSQSDGLEPNHAAAWTKDLDSGLWTVQLLPDNGPGLPSEALCITHDNIFIDDVHIGGAAGTDSSPMVPCVWSEQPGGGFDRVDLPMLPGAYLGVAKGTGRTTGHIANISIVGFNASVAGLADLYRGVLYRRINGLWGAPLELLPLPGLRDAKAGGVALGTSNSPDGLTVVGHSYVELSPGSERATLWEVASDDTVTTYDLNDQTVNLPPGVTLFRAFPVKWEGPSLSWAAGGHTNVDAPSVPHGNILIKLSEADCNENGNDDALDLYSGASSDSNANGILDECEGSIPAASTWGLVSFALLMATAGTAAIGRKQRSNFKQG